MHCSRSCRRIRAAVVEAEFDSELVDGGRLALSILEPGVLDVKVGVECFDDGTAADKELDPGLSLKA